MAETVPQPEPTSCFRCGDPLDGLFRCTACGAVSQAGCYRPTKVLAENPHSRMYLAQDASGRKVALKELVFALVPSVDALEAFEREGKFLQRLEHPGIPRFVESFRLGTGVHTRLYLAQEFLEGVTLATRIEKQRLSETEFVHLAQQVLAILSYLHGQTPKMIHRDIKPANLILRPNGTVALVDFGAARDLTGTQTYGSTLVGTFGYMPPEQLGGTVDETSDLYGLGASLLHAVTGKRPDSMFHRGIAIDASAEKLPLSPARRRFLLRLVEPRHSARFASAAAALNELQSPRRHPRPIAVAALALLAAGVLAGWLTRAPFPGMELPWRARARAGADSVPGPKSGYPKEIEQEALQHLRAIYTAEKAYYAEKDKYSADLKAIGFEPNDWCPDGARLRIPKPASASEAVGCHFVYRVELSGSAPNDQFIMYAHGAAPPAIGLDFSVGSDGDQRGILQRILSGN